MIFRLRRPMKWRIFENTNLYNEIFRGGDLYYICANLWGFSQVMSHTTAKSQNTMRCERMP